MKGQIKESLKDGLLRHCFAFAVLASVAMVSPSQAQILTLNDAGCVAQINTGTQAGMFNWSVGGINQLKQQWFWYRVGTIGAELSIDTISAPIISGLSANQATVSYANASFSVDVTYVLTGNTASSGLNESIRIINNTSDTLDFHFFEYSDFDLNGVAGGQSVSLNATAARARQTSLQGSALVASETAGPNANHREAALFNQTLNKLNDASPTTLNDILTAGPGDATFAFQWDYSIAAGGSTLISKLKNVAVPEPSALALMVVGLAAFTLRRKRAV